ncbi:hypothetical protein EBZ57_03315 [bacterium]|nr:hypothetical protein [bacterium]
MKLLCSGNPSHKTIASAVKLQWPTADFASRATGFDLRFWTPGSEAFFRQKIINYDCFINSSFICGNGQMALLEVTVEEWVKAGIKGTIVNIGSSAEWQGTDSRHGVYGIQKRALRDRSLQLHGKQGIRTMHVTAGLLNDGAPQNRAGLDLNHVAQTIKWALEQPFCLPLLYIENT